MDNYHKHNRKFCFLATNLSLHILWREAGTAGIVAAASSSSRESYAIGGNRGLYREQLIASCDVVRAASFAPDTVPTTTRFLRMHEKSRSANNRHASDSAPCIRARARTFVTARQRATLLYWPSPFGRRNLSSAPHVCRARLYQWPAATLARASSRAEVDKHV